MKFSLLAALDIVILTMFLAVSYENLDKNTFPF